MNKQMYKEQLGDLITENNQLKKRIKELETELYFINRNNKIEQVVSENSSQMDIFDDTSQMDIFEDDKDV